MNRYEQQQEDVYQCKKCGQLFPESTVAVRLTNKEKYCDICQGEVEVCGEQNNDQSRKRSPHQTPQ